MRLLLPQRYETSTNLVSETGHVKHPRGWGGSDAPSVQGQMSELIFSRCSAILKRIQQGARSQETKHTFKPADGGGLNVTLKCGGSLETARSGD